MSDSLIATTQPRPAQATRLTIVETIYFQLANSQPISIPVRFTRSIKIDEQPWTRKLRIGEQWQDIDKGWIKNHSMLVLVNEEGQFPQKVPTPEEKADTVARIIEVGNIGVSILVRPGESTRIEPKQLENFRLRCQRGEARCTLYIFPGEDQE